MFTSQMPHGQSHQTTWVIWPPISWLQGLDKVGVVAVRHRGARRSTSYGTAAAGGAPRQWGAVIGGLPARYATASRALRHMNEVAPWPCGGWRLGE